MHDSFLPTVEAFNGTLWGSEPRLPATCPKSRQEEGKVDPDCEKDGFFGVGVTSHAMVLNDRIYVIGHNRYSGMYGYSGYKEIVTDQLGKEVKRTYWPEFPSLNKRREGFAVVVYRGRIYAIGGRTTCKVESKAENPDSRCITDGHLTRTDQATADRCVREGAYACCGLFVIWFFRRFITSEYAYENIISKNPLSLSIYP